MKKFIFLYSILMLLLFASNSFAFAPVQIPEPASILLLGTGLVGLAIVGRKIKK